MVFAFYFFRMGILLLVYIHDWDCLSVFIVRSDKNFIDCVGSNTYMIGIV